MKKLFISLKGFGDLVVLADALNKASSLESHAVIVSKRLNEMANSLMPKNVSIYNAKGLEDLLPLYHLRRKSPFIFEGIRDLRSIANKKVKDGHELVIDFFECRNEFLFFGIKHRYLPRAGNIYDSYASEFNFTVSDNYLTVDKKRTIVIFPFGSSFDRSISLPTLDRIANFLSKNNFSFCIACHETDISRLGHQFSKEIYVFNSSIELMNLIKNSLLLISVDTVALHLSHFFNIPSFVLTNNWKYFMPPGVIKNNRIYTFAEFNTLLSDVKNFLS